MGFLFLRMPTAYLPDEDQGMLLAQVIMPTGRDPGADPEGHGDRSSAIFRRKKRRRWSPA